MQRFSHQLLITRSIYVMLVLALTVLLVELTGIVTLSQWYSPEIDHRLQTEALLNKELAIRDHPYDHGLDRIWGKGLHQNFGLGVPLLRLPFEAVARLIGLSSFPDRLVFLICFSVAAFGFVWGLRSIPCLSDKAGLTDIVEHTLITLVCFMNPTFIAMLCTRFNAYEETIAYGCVWAFGLVGLLLRYSNRPKIRLFFGLCFLAGFSSMIRPTGFFYGLISVSLGVFIAYKSRLSFGKILLGIALYGLWPITHLYTNYLRFGEPFEFGYHLVLSTESTVDYMLRISNPFAEEPFLKATQELLGSLFLVKELNGFDFYRASMHWWQSDTLRFREYYFSGLSLFTLFATVLGWISAFLCVLFKPDILKIKKSLRQALLILGVWSGITFTAMFLFYLRSPVFASRFAIDFLPAVAIGMSVTILFLSSIAQHALKGRWVILILTVVTITWIIGTVRHARFSMVNRLSTYRPPGAISLEEVSSAVLNPDVGPPLPNEYVCGATNSNYSIPSNLVGWVHYLKHPQLGPKLVCLAKRSITLFFGPFACIELEIQATNQDVGFDIDSIQVRAGTQFLIRQAVDHSERIQKVKFCTDDLSSIDNQYNLITIGLTTKDGFKDSIVHKGFHLLAVKALSPQRKISQ